MGRSRDATEHAMHTLRRIFVLQPRDALAGLSYPRAIALFIVIAIPGGLVLPLCYGLYGAIRHTLSRRILARVSDPQDQGNPASDTRSRDR